MQVIANETVTFHPSSNNEQDYVKGNSKKIMNTATNDDQNSTLSQTLWKVVMMKAMLLMMMTEGWSVHKQSKEISSWHDRTGQPILPHSASMVHKEFENKILETHDALEEVECKVTNDIFD